MNTGPDRIELMQTFVRIVEAGSLSAAAAQMGTTQPTVSRRLQSLERSLGVQLLQRSTHAMQLTGDGARCYEQAKVLLADWEALEADLRGTGDVPVGTLRVVVPHAFGQQQLVRPLVDYLQRHAGVAVEWRLDDDPPDFIGGGIDCAIRVGPAEDPAVVALKIAEVPRIVVAAPALSGCQPLPRRPHDLAALPWLALHTYYRAEVRLARSDGSDPQSFPIQPRLCTDSLFALRSAALMGLGAAIVSAWVVEEDLRSGRLLHLVPEWHAAPLPVYLLYPHARFYPARLRRFLEAMRTAWPGTEPGSVDGAQGGTGR
ncbi:LysR family transcriptional regulator [Sphingomonas sp. NCPPB 2930]